MVLPSIQNRVVVKCHNKQNQNSPWNFFSENCFSFLEEVFILRLRFFPTGLFMDAYHLNFSYHCLLIYLGVSRGRGLCYVGRSNWLFSFINLRTMRSSFVIFWRMRKICISGNSMNWRRRGVNGSLISTKRRISRYIIPSIIMMMHG
jgi:hypothetical protein